MKNPMVYFEQIEFLVFWLQSHSNIMLSLDSPGPVHISAGHNDGERI
jgi:hypothetical protein